MSNEVEVEELEETEETETDNSDTANPSELDQLKSALDNIPDTEIHKRLRNMISSGKINTYIYASDEDLTPLHAIMRIVERWTPAVDNEGYIIENQTGDYDSIDELDKDSLYLSTLSVQLGMLMGRLNAQAEAAKLNMDNCKSRLRVVARSFKKNLGKKRSSITDKHMEDITRTHQLVAESEEFWITTTELSKIITAAYYAADRLEKKLQARIKIILSDWYRRTE